MLAKCGSVAVPWIFKRPDLVVISGFEAVFSFNASLVHDSLCSVKHFPDRGQLLFWRQLNCLVVVVFFWSNFLKDLFIVS